ncbi:hypothetical protein BU24DRAFT_316276, partial [Aaosphaeria arxii CBS 175.79]
TKTLTATCHCTSSTLSFAVPTSSFPLVTHFCNCSICRYTHGTLASIHTSIPDPPTITNPDTFTTYKSSKKVTRWFCKTCGAHLVDCAVSSKGVESWCVATSLVGGVEGSREELWEFKRHIFVGDTEDGGLANWIFEYDGKKLEKWIGRDATVRTEENKHGDWVHHDVGNKEKKEKSNVAEDKLKASCHCGGVEFYISRPGGDKAFDSLPSSLTPKDRDKWYASNDVCDSCRLVSSSMVVSWVFPDTSHISLPDGSPWRFEFGTAKTYKTSEDVTRSFCGTCGALVCYSTADRPDMIDIGVGLLRGKSVLCEDWLEWRTNKLSWEEDCKWPGFSESLKKGLKQWGE